MNKKDAGQLQERLRRMGRIVHEVGKPWAVHTAQTMKKNYLHNLSNQGRSGNSPPPLSSATLKLYDRNGSSDGSGVRDHVKVVTHETKNHVASAMVIEEGRPSMIAKVQNDGCTIRVTPRMRGYLASQGIFLKASTVAIVIPGRKSLDKAEKQTKLTAYNDLKKRIKLWWEKENADN